MWGIFGSFFLKKHFDGRLTQKTSSCRNAKNFFCALCGDLPLEMINNLDLFYTNLIWNRKDDRVMITKKGSEKWYFLIFLTRILGLFWSIIRNANFLTNNESQTKKTYINRLSKTRVTFCANFYLLILRFTKVIGQQKKRNRSVRPLKKHPPTRRS